MLIALDRYVYSKDICISSTRKERNGRNGKEGRSLIVPTIALASTKIQMEITYHLLDVGF